MTAGTGVLHSEQNASDTEAVHFLQIWVQPARQRLQPGYEQRAFPAKDRTGRLTLLASQDGRDGSVTIHQDVNLYSAALETGNRVTLPLEERPARVGAGCARERADQQQRADCR